LVKYRLEHESFAPDLPQNAAFSMGF